NQIRAIALEPLTQLIADMQAAGLQPQIISGYRSYYSQNIAFQKWVEKEPERATQLSARPGHSEHQLGTTVDFGSPVLYQYVEGADEKIEFHTYFFKTPEGIWLLENAHTYGFTLSYPREAQEITGFYYEPWHYRYVGVEMATFLKENGLSLTAFQLQSQPPPCIPEEG
ncbi:MAG: M15 family metallopeptidase, partial [Anaerolineales bacterium]|nr:M15 family metallopeptidase [Anaerolineales bacterium]